MLHGHLLAIFNLAVSKIYNLVHKYIKTKQVGNEDLIACTLSTFLCRTKKKTAMKHWITVYAFSGKLSY